MLDYCCHQVHKHDDRVHCLVAGDLLGRLIESRFSSLLVYLEAELGETQVFLVMVQARANGSASPYSSPRT